MKRLARNGVLACGSILVSLAVAELIIRASGTPVGTRTEPISPFGARYVPNSAFVLEDEHYLRGRMNNVGFHDRPFAFGLPTSTYRIGFFGDSVTEARHVEADSTFVSLFEDEANAAGMDVEASSFGLIGSSADLSLFRCLHAMQQARFDEIVYVFYRNDFIDGSVENEKPASWPFLKRDSLGAFYFSGAYQTDRALGWRAGIRKLVKPWISELSLPSFFAYRLAVYRTARRVNAGWRPAAANDSLHGLFGLGDGIPEDLRPAQQHWVDVVRFWSASCRARGVAFRILYIPPTTEVEDSTYAATRREGVPRYGLADWVAGVCAREGIAFSNPTDAFLRAQTGPGRELYWSHLNYKGHRVLGRFLVDELRVARQRAFQ